MVARIKTVAFQGIEVVGIDVQVQTANGLPAFTIVGLADKAVGESRERVRAALHAMGLALPNKRITVNLSPADLAKEGSHYDLPIALGLLVAMGLIEQDDIDPFVALGELALDGSVLSVTGVLPAAVFAVASGGGLICPAAHQREALWSDNQRILAVSSLLALLNHFKGAQTLAYARRGAGDGLDADPDRARAALDMREVKGQETAKRVLEVAAAGGHHLLMVGPPGSGKSMLAARLPGLLPKLTAPEVLEVSMVLSVAGEIRDGQLSNSRPFREPHHSATMASLVGGGNRIRPGEISLAHLGVLFLDELPEFNRAALEALRQPLETGQVSIARANAHLTYPARVQLVGAMNPCRCGHLADPLRACTRAPKCGETYQNRLSGPLLDRFDLHVDVPAVRPRDLTLPPAAEGSAEIRRRVEAARQIQADRLRQHGAAANIRCNADMDGDLLMAVAEPDAPAKTLLMQAAERFALSARAYHRVIRVARTLADLDAATGIGRIHIAEALSYRKLERQTPTRELRVVG
ncbi:MAG: YifB family Mg chelatase-like AAA ATPase [Rhodospirillales bacterium]|nr:YifB family Mg chelatase-like AAA ATPase [Rhodospirillales bacterium]